jgi:hypothetical protein
MGHWSQEIASELAEQLGGDPDLGMVQEAANAAAREIELLAGRTYHEPRRATASIDPNGLPFVDVPDVLIGSVESGAGVWPIPDLADAQHATVLQLVPAEVPARKAVTTADALGIAGDIVFQMSQAGALSGEAVLHWLGRATHHTQREELFRRIMDPSVRYYVPICGVLVAGWWFQVSRRLLWFTDETEDEGRLLELLLPEGTEDGEPIPLFAVEPVLIAARMTRQPVDRALLMRIWTEDVQRPVDRSWSILAKAVHGHGVPTITVDRKSNTQEIACQAILKGYWHGYVRGDSPALARAIATAYPSAVERIRRGTGAPSRESAAATLLEQLLHPGFDPARGAEATRRYVRRKASIAVMEHRKGEHPANYPWTRVGVSERRYYKLLPRFATKVNGRYSYDHDDVVARMRAHLDERDRLRDIRKNALSVLRDRGFSDAAARKWLQRHRPQEAIHATPRGRRSDATNTTG